MSKQRGQMSFTDEIIVDGFAGGGGWSTGIEQATGTPVDIAINHDPDAILMHMTNHPFTEHFCESIYEVDPIKVTRGRPVGWAHFSPDCKHFSKAKGGKPVEKKIRGLAWVVLKWAGMVRPRIISLENVEEFQTWGPVRRGRPVKSRQGETFNKFVSQLEELGYAVEWRELVAADYGAPTTRKRFFMLARCDGRQIEWPKPTHAPADSCEVIEGLKKPWRAAAEIIDWSLPCPSIFANKEQIKKAYGIKAVRPLANNTMKRVARGLDKFVIHNAAPFIVQVNHSGDFRGQDLEKPLQTITGKHGYGVAEPTVLPLTMHNNTNAQARTAAEPTTTITTGGHQMLITPTLTSIGQTGFAADRARRLLDPIPTTVSKAETCVVAPSLVQYHTEKHGEYVRGQATDTPINTLDASNRYGIAAASLIKYYGAGVGQDVQAPAHTVTSKDREALALACLQAYRSASIGTPAADPAPTTTAKEHEAITMAYMQKYYAGGNTEAGIEPSKPLPTITAIDHNAVAAAHIVKFKGTNLGHEPQQPLQTITASATSAGNGGGTFGVCRAYLIKASAGVDLHYWPQVRALLNEYCGYTIALDELLVLEIDNVQYFIADIGLRMLVPRELYLANGFPADYIIARDYTGAVYGKSKQVARCGNAVPPPFAVALVRANWPERCKGVHIETMHQLIDHIAI